MRWYDAESAPPGVPIMDLGGLDGTGPGSRQFEAAAHAIGEIVAAGSGMFYVRGHGVPNLAVDRLVAVTEEFFALPEGVRREMVCSDLPLRGYSGLGAESAAKVFGSGDHPDLCMKYSWTAQNVYPSAIFRDAWDAYQEASGRACRLLLRLIRHALGQTGRNEAVWSQVIDGEAMIRHLSYPDIPVEGDGWGHHQERMAAHNDIGAITLLYQTPCPNGFVSLQAEVDGSFVPVPAIEGTMVVNLGDVLVHLTGGAVKAARHRVLRSPGRGGERTATLCFFFPDPEFDLQSLDGSDFQGLLDKAAVSTFAQFLNHLSALYCGKSPNRT